MSNIRNLSKTPAVSLYNLTAVIVALATFWIGADAQTMNRLAVNVQQSASFQTTRSFSTSLMLGVQADDRSQIFIGGTIKKFAQEIGHKKTHIGLRAHAQSTIGENSNFTPFIDIYALKGEHYIYEEIGDSTASIKNATHIGAAIGVGYMFTQNLGLFLGYAIREYNPRNYYNRKKSPYKKNAAIIKLSYSVPLGGGFDTSGVGQRRMW